MERQRRFRLVEKIHTDIVEPIAEHSEKGFAVRASIERFAAPRFLMRSFILSLEELVHGFGAQEEAGRRRAAMRAGAKLKAEWRIFRFCIRAGNICTDGRHVTRTWIYRREGLDKRALAA